MSTAIAIIIPVSLGLILFGAIFRAVGSSLVSPPADAPQYRKAQAEHVKADFRRIGPIVLAVGLALGGLGLLLLGAAAVR